MPRKLAVLIVLTAALGIATHATALAAPVFFVNNPSTNSVDWAATLGAINTNVDFDTHPLGALIPAFYTGSDGVTLTATGPNLVSFGAGPGQGNTGGAIPGEGLHPASNFLEFFASPDTLTISFATPVAGAGFFTLDYFGPFGPAMSLTAFGGPNGTGANLGSATSPLVNLQMNNLYFMGVSDTSNSIGSVVWSYNGSSTGDIMGIDDIQFGVLAGPGGGVPEIDPSSAALPMSLVIAAWCLLADLRRRSASTY